MVCPERPTAPAKPNLSRLFEDLCLIEPTQLFCRSGIAKLKPLATSPHGATPTHAPNISLLNDVRTEKV